MWCVLKKQFFKLLHDSQSQACHSTPRFPLANWIIEKPYFTTIYTHKYYITHLFKIVIYTSLLWCCLRKYLSLKRILVHSSLGKMAVLWTKPKLSGTQRSPEHISVVCLVTSFSIDASFCLVPSSLSFLCRERRVVLSQWQRFFPPLFTAMFTVSFSGHSQIRSRIMAEDVRLMVALQTF